MRILRNPEYRGILFLLLVIATVGFSLAVATGTIELFTGPRAFDKIVYISEQTGSPEIWIMNTDGSNRKPLTNGANVRSAPAVSPKANRIIYVGKFGKFEQVFAIDTRGRHLDRLTSVTGPKQLPAFTPDGNTISFIASGRVYTADKRGENLSPILPTPQETHTALTDPLRRGEMPVYLSYAWGPDSEAIVGIRQEPDGNHSAVFLQRQGAKPKLIPFALLLNQLIAQEGVSNRRISPDELIQVTGLSWARDVPAFAITLSCGKDSFLTVFSVENGEPRLMGFKSFIATKIAEPNFAPDGSAIVTIIKSLRRGGEEGLLMINLESGIAQLVASGTFEKPQYSPLGDEILATRREPENANKNLVSVDLTTGKIRRLTQDGCSYFGVWSPSSKKPD
ncbi:MAG: TolB family protein [Armatimonadota bacterium]